MPDILEPVKLPASHRKLVCDFLLVFSRFEFALKSQGYFYLSGDSVMIDRKRFAKDVQDKLTLKLELNENRKLIQPLLDRPPDKEIGKGAVIDWVSTPAFTGHTIQAEFLLKATYGVRNNLFHGGKRPQYTVRDQDLLRAALAVIRCCLDVHTTVAKEYFLG
jgi:hypothetical protein